MIVKPNNTLNNYGSGIALLSSGNSFSRTLELKFNDDKFKPRSKTKSKKKKKKNNLNTYR